MGTITPTISKAVPAIVTATWALAGADTGVGAAIADWADKSVQITGTFGGATVTIEGSNDGSNWFTLHEPSGAALSFAAAGLKQVLEFTLYTRAVSAGGTDSAIAVVLAGRNDAESIRS